MWRNGIFPECVGCHVRSLTVHELGQEDPGHGCLDIVGGEALERGWVHADFCFFLCARLSFRFRSGRGGSRCCDPSRLGGCFCIRRLRGLCARPFGARARALLGLQLSRQPPLQLLVLLL